MKKYLNLLLIISSSWILLSGFCFFKLNFDSDLDIKKERQKLRDIQAKETTSKTFDGEVEPRMPDDKINDSTPEGIDANKNGIRDDVEIWINRRQENDVNKRRAGKQRAKALQKIVIAGNKNDVKELWRLDYVESWKAGTCLLQQYKKTDQETQEWMRFSDEITDLIFNATCSRRDAYDNMDNSRRKNPYSVFNGQQPCEFTLE